MELLKDWKGVDAIYETDSYYQTLTLTDVYGNGQMTASVYDSSGRSFPGSFRRGVVAGLTGADGADGAAALGPNDNGLASDYLTNIPIAQYFFGQKYRPRIGVVGTTD